MSVSVRIVRLQKSAELPKYMTPGAAGCDVSACLEKAVTFLPAERGAIPTGLSVQIPEGFEIQVRPRSGLAFKKGLTVINAPGTIDSDYRGEIKILVINLGREAVTIEPGDRIAQLVIQRVEQIDWREVEALQSSARDIGGFGSTGVNA